MAFLLTRIIFNQLCIRSPHRKTADGGDSKGAPCGIDVNAGWRMPITQLLCKKPPYGGISAIDLDTGEQLWDRPLGTARRNGPFGIHSMLPSLYEHTDW
ncbi:MAG: glucose dehydrogenase [Oceanicoccus sp.]